MLLAATAAGLSACGSSAAGGQSTVIVKDAAVSQTTAAAVAPTPTVSAGQAPGKAAVKATASKTALSSATTAAPAPPSGAQPPSRSATTAASPAGKTAAPARKAIAASTTTKARAADGNPKPLKPAACLSEAGLQQVRALAGGEWSGHQHLGSVFVLGPYKSTGATSGAAHALAGVRGGDYVVYAKPAHPLTGVVDTVASCLGPGGTSSYTF